MCRTVLSNSAPLFFHENERCNAQQLHENLLLQVCAFEVNEEALYRASWISSVAAAATTAAGIAPVAKHWSSSIAADEAREPRTEYGAAVRPTVGIISPTVMWQARRIGP